MSCGPDPRRAFCSRRRTRWRPAGEPRRSRSGRSPSISSAALPWYAAYSIDLLGQPFAPLVYLIGGFGFNASPVGRTVDVVRYDGAIFETSWQGWDNAPSTNVRVDAACIFTKDQVSPGDHNLVTLEVEIPADLPPGTVIPVELTNVQFFNYDFSVPTLIPRDGSITVLRSSDLDGDGTVGAEDLGRLLAAWGPAESDAAADLDGDLVVDGFDLGRLLDRWGGQG